MMFPVRMNPGAVAGDEDRFTHRGVFLAEHEGKPYLCSTDGRALLMVPVDCEADEATAAKGRHYPIEAIDRARKIPTCKVTGKARLILNGDARGIDGSVFPAIEATPPDLKGIIPSGPCVSVTLDIGRLAALAKGMGADHITLEIRENKGGDKLPVRVIGGRFFKGKGRGARTEQETVDAIAVLMPIA